MNDAAGRRLLVLSPHLDDAVLSAGAGIAAWTRTGGQAVVCTAFAGTPTPQLSPVAEAFHADCGLDYDAMTVRRLEDATALRRLGAHPVHLDFQDAVYRRVGDSWLCRHDRAMFDLDLPVEPALLADLTAQFADLVTRVEPDQVWTCGAWGGHVDHRIARRAATAACGAAALWLWEDLPYAIWQPREPPASVTPASPVVCTDVDMTIKLTAVEAYRSQLPMLWPDGDWRIELLAHAATRRPFGGPELLWKLTPAAVHRANRSQASSSGAEHE